MEHAVAHGYLMATSKGYAEKRARLRRRGASKDGQAGDWASTLAALSGQVRHAGGSAPAPADSPVAGMTTASFRAEVAAMREAEYERARQRKARPD